MERWGTDWGFRFSVEKTKIMFFTKKKVNEVVSLNLYGSRLERVKCFRFWGSILTPG